MTDRTLTVTLNLDTEQLAAELRETLRRHIATALMADRYAANEAKQREAGADCPTLVECLRTLEATRPGTDDQPGDAAYRDGLTTAYDHLRSVLAEHGVPVSPRVDEPEMSEAAEWLSRGGADPLDENDHRDRMLVAISERIVRVGHKHWHTPGWANCNRRKHGEQYGYSLEGWNASDGPLTFAPDADGAPSATAPVADGPADDAVDGEEGERRYLNAQTCREILAIVGRWAGKCLHMWAEDTRVGDTTRYFICTECGSTRTEDRQ